MKPALSCLFVMLACAAITLFSAPVFSKDTQLAFISSEKDHAIAVVDLKTMTVVNSIKTCKRPRHMQRLAGNTQMMVACSDSGKADLIDLATQKSIGQFSLGEDPEIFDISPDGKTIFVSNEEDGALNIVEAGSGKLLKSVKVGKEPEGVKVTADGKTVYVTSEVANMVHVVDIASGKITKNIQVGKRPRRFALSNDGKELWVTNELDASASIIDTTTLAVTATLKFTVPGVREADITPVGLIFSKDGKTAYVGLGRANHVAQIDIATRKTGKLALVGKRAWGVALNSKDTQLFVVNGLSDDMTVLNTSDFKPIKTIAVGRVPHTVVIDD
jgi:PQQ-dependent catabolism-associated beta-propeller protein